MTWTSYFVALAPRAHDTHIAPRSLTTRAPAHSRAMPTLPAAASARLLRARPAPAPAARARALPARRRTSPAHARRVANRHRARLRLFLLPRKRSSRFRVHLHRPRGGVTASSAALDASAGTTPSRVTPPEPAPVTEHEWEWEGHTIRYTRSGESGPAMVLVHGFGGNADHWRKNTPVLGRRGRAFAIDLLGYGYSSKPDPMRGERNGIYNFENWSRQIRAFCEEVVGEPAFVMCNSVGGVAGLQAAVDDARWIRGVVLINVSLRGLHVTKQPAVIRPFVKALQTTLRETSVGKSFFATVAREKTVRNILREAYGDPDAVTDELVECILKPGLQPGAAEVFLDFISYSGGPLPEELLPIVPESVPVRILWGQADPWEVVKEGRAYGEFESVDRFIELPGVGHCPMDEAPELVNPLLMEFVEDYRASTPGAP